MDDFFNSFRSVLQAVVNQFGNAISDGDDNKNRSETSQSLGSKNYWQGKDFEDYTEDKLDQQFKLKESDLWASIPSGNASLYASTKFNQNTQIDIEIADGNDDLVAIVECKSGSGSTPNQFKRLIEVSNDEGVKLIIATPDGKWDDQLSSTDIEMLKNHETYIIDPNDLYESNSSGLGIHKGLPLGFLGLSESNNINIGANDYSSDDDSISFESSDTDNRSFESWDSPSSDESVYNSDFESSDTDKSSFESWDSQSSDDSSDNSSSESSDTDNSSFESWDSSDSKPSDSGGDSYESSSWF